LPPTGSVRDLHPQSIIHVQRTKRSALRASQGCAPDQASKTEGAVGRARWESSFLELPGANYSEENHSGKKKRQNRKKGTFLKSFDNHHE
jgi:hypothetical protein